MQKCAVAVWKKMTRKKRRNAQSPLFRKCQQATSWHPYPYPLPTPYHTKWRPIYSIYYTLYTWYLVYMGTYKTACQAICVLFFFFAFWPAKLMQKQMVSNMVETNTKKKCSKCDKPKGWERGGEGVRYSLQQEVQQLQQQRWRPATATNSIKSLPLKLEGFGGGYSGCWGQLRGARGGRGTNCATWPAKQVRQTCQIAWLNYT